MGNETTAVVFVIDCMNDTGYGYEYFLHVSFFVGFFQFAGKSEIIALSKEISFAAHTVPGACLITDIVLPGNIRPDG